MTPFVRRLFPLLLVLAGARLAAQPARYTVAVHVGTDNEFTELLQSVVTRELRRFVDVTVVPLESPHQFVLSANALPLQTPDGRRHGVALSYVFIDVTHFGHFTAIIGTAELGAELEQAVAKFDREFLEPRRRTPS